MQSSPQNFMPILFKVLFGFIIFNIIINFVLYYLNRRRLYKLLAIFWPVVLFVFVMQASFQTGNLSVTLAYGASLLSITVISMIGFEAIGSKFPLRNYIIYYAFFFPITFLFYFLGFDFTTLAMPIAIATATPLLHIFILIHFIKRNSTTRMQKVLGIVYLISAIHCINFAIFRMDPGAQLWGWLVAYLTYDMNAILLPSIALEESNLSETFRLNTLVLERTHELDSTLKINEKLLRVLLHDISNPLMAINFNLSKIKPFEIVDESRLIKVKKLAEVIDEVLTKVRDIYSTNLNKNKNKNTLSLYPVVLEDCFNEVAFIFTGPLSKKDVTLSFKNQLLPGTMVMGDKTSLTHSVLSNLVSNALKFSSPHSVIEVVTREEQDMVILEVNDRGPGIPLDILSALNSGQSSVVSTKGTSGEKGLGLGLTIVKSFVDSYGGQIEFASREITNNPDNHGTSIRISLAKASMLT